MRHLYIIGNGFDLHHDIWSGFMQYAEWLKITHPDLYTDVMNTYQIDDNTRLWKDFEHLLGQLEVQYNAARLAYEHYPDFEKLPDTDSAYDDAGNEYSSTPTIAQEEFEEFFESIRQSFAEWVMQLNQPNEDKRLPIEGDSKFVTFNYTDVLESLYHVDQQDIIYIHGCAKRGNKLILGHGLNEQTIRNSEAFGDANIEDHIEGGNADHSDWVVGETFETILHQLLQVRKPVEECMHKLESLWGQCNDIESIHIYGLSFSDIDLPYIDEILRHVDMDSVKWEVSYFGEKEKDLFENELLQRGVPKTQIQMIRLVERT